MRVEGAADGVAAEPPADWACGTRRYVANRRLAGHVRAVACAFPVLQKAPGRVAENAVVVVSCWKPADMVEAQRIAGLFEPLVRSVVIVPFDNALKAGRIRFDAMQPNTQRAWLAAAAAVGRGL